MEARRKPRHQELPTALGLLHSKKGHVRLLQEKRESQTMLLGEYAFVETDNKEISALPRA